MGTKHPDQISPVYWREGVETVEDMVQRRWDLIVACRHCRVMMHVDLRVIAFYKGRDFSLWNRTARCRVLHCPGLVDFSFKAPGMTRHKRLAAPPLDEPGKATDRREKV